MPFNFYAETSFTEMRGRGYFGVRVLPRPQKYHPRLQLSNDRRPQSIGIQSYQQQCTLFYHGLKMSVR